MMVQGSCHGLLRFSLEHSHVVDVLTLLSEAAFLALMKEEGEAVAWRGSCPKTHSPPFAKPWSMRTGLNSTCMTLDGHLVLHHDRTPMIPKHEKEGRPTYVEAWTLDELREFGAETFDEMLADPIISTAWREQAKVGVIEIKRPHPRHIGRGWWNDDRRDLPHMSALTQRVEAALKKLIFQNKHGAVCLPSEDARPRQDLWVVSSLVTLDPEPSAIRQRRCTARGRAPSFVRNSFARLVRTHRAAGSPMMPCALTTCTACDVTFRWAEASACRSCP